MGESLRRAGEGGGESANPLVVGVNLAYLRPGEMGGSEVYLREVIERASRLEGVSFVLFCNHPAAESFESSDRVRIVELSGRRFSQLSRLWDENVELAFALKRNPVDLIWSPANFVGVALATRLPQVATIHDLQHRLRTVTYSGSSPDRVGEFEE